MALGCSVVELKLVEAGCRILVAIRGGWYFGAAVQGGWGLVGHGSDAVVGVLSLKIIIFM